MRNVGRARHHIVHERRVDQLSIGAVDDLLAEHLAEPLRDATMGLPVDDHRVDDGADIVDCHVADYRHHAGLRIDLDLADMAAIRKRHLRRDELAQRVEPVL